MITQLDIYTEEKYEDEEDLRERSLAAHRRTASPTEAALDELIRSAKQVDDLYPLVVESLTHLRQVLESDTSPYVTSLSRVARISQCSVFQSNEGGHSVHYQQVP